MNLNQKNSERGRLGELTCSTGCWWAAAAHRQRNRFHQRGHDSELVCLCPGKNMQNAHNQSMQHKAFVPMGSEMGGSVPESRHGYTGRNQTHWDGICWCQPRFLQTPTERMGILKTQNGKCGCYCIKLAPATYQAGCCHFCRSVPVVHAPQGRALCGAFFGQQQMSLWADNPPAKIDKPLPRKQEHC